MANTDGTPNGDVQIRSSIPPRDPDHTRHPGRGPAERSRAVLRLRGCHNRPIGLQHRATGSTGDIGTLDAEGRLTITGRIGNVIIRGENMAAAEVEAHLVAHPGVSAAVVVGMADDRLGERVAAVVELLPARTVRSGEVS